MIPKGGMKNIIKKAQELQSQMEKAQQELNSIEIEGQSGGGMVTAKVNGHKEIVTLDIEPEVLKEDKEMIEEIKDIRVHLYPSHKFEVSAFSLSETQALGMPAIVRPLGAATEKIYNGKTGFIAENEKLFSEYVIKLLSDLTYFKSVNKESKSLKLGRDWNKVAEEFIQVFKS